VVRIINLISMANNNKSNYKKLINTGVPEKCDICGISE
jgi:hypothetical protein